MQNAVAESRLIVGEGSAGCIRGSSQRGVRQRELQRNMRKILEMVDIFTILASLMYL